MIRKYGLNLSDERHPVMVAEEVYTTDEDCLNSPRKVAEFCKTVLKLDRRAEEYLYLFCFDSKNRLLGMFEVSHGTVNSSLLGVREVFIRALICGAVHIILIHNHPSGIVLPSEEDDRVCQRIFEAGKLLNVSLTDFMVIGERCYLSYREEYRIIWSGDSI